nr:pVI [Myotis fimbriatus mastadenovirus]
MEEINFTALAPRLGTRPMLSEWDVIGTCSMNGGAFSWGSLWNSARSIGSRLKNLGLAAWNSSTGEALKQKLRDTNLQEKVVEGISSGIHGAVDIARQQVERAIDRQLGARAPVREIVTEEVAAVPVKRPREDDEEDLVIRTDEPPAYDEIYTSGAPDIPVTRPIAPLVTPVAPAGPPVRVVPAAAPATVASIASVARNPVLVKGPSASAPVVSVPAARVALPASSSRLQQRPWQAALSNIVGVGVNFSKRRRCF